VCVWWGRLLAGWGETSVNTGTVGVAQADVGGVWATLEGDHFNRDWKSGVADELRERRDGV
jgi:hypothetical protein